MKLRIARKMDTKRKGHKDKPHRRWWSVYSDDQLRRAMVRLRKRWSRNHKVDAEGYRKTAPDWFMSNRIESRLIRQGALRRIRRGTP